MIKELFKLYRRTMLITGFLKSTIGTGLISLGLTTIFVAYTAAPGMYPDHTPLIGIILLIGGVLTYYSGDLYNISQSEKLEVLRLKKASDIVDYKINQEKDRLAEEVLKKAEREKEKIDIDVARQLRDIRDGICADLNQMANGDMDLEYCGTHKGNKQLEYVRYPDGTPVAEIIQIGINKLKLVNETVTIPMLKDYCNDLYDIGLITKNKLNECIDKLNEE